MDQLNRTIASWIGSNLNEKGLKEYISSYERTLRKPKNRKEITMSDKKTISSNWKKFGSDLKAF